MRGKAKPATNGSSSLVIVTSTVANEYGVETAMPLNSKVRSMEVFR